MFPFVIKGKVPLGLRRDYHLSEAGLRERIAERLIKPARRSEARTDGSPSGDGRGLVVGGLSRLKSLGLLTAVRIRKISIITRKDFIFAGYEMDAIASTLVSMVIVPLVLGSILFAHGGFSFYQALAILVLLVLASWGLDVFVLVMLLRHEIYLIASEIRGIMRRYDTQKIDPHHHDISSEDLLATAYFYERNGLVKRCEAYLAHLAARHPDSFEAALAREHMDMLGGIPARSLTARTREGAKVETSGPGKMGLRIKFRKPLSTGRESDEKGHDQALKKKRRGWFKMPGFLRRNTGDKEVPVQTDRRAWKRTRLAEGTRKKGLFRRRTRETTQERAVRKRRERLMRREEFAKTPDEKSLTRGTRFRLKLTRLLSREGREERRYRKKQERWLHGPRTRRSAPWVETGSNRRKDRRPNWMRSKEEKQALQMQRRWSEGPPGPGRIQRSRDRWVRWLLRRGENGEGRLLPNQRPETRGGLPQANEQPTP